MNAAQLDRAFFALSSAPRRQIVAELSRRPTTMPELGKRFSFSKQALSKHVAVLEDAGVVSRKVRGRTHELSLKVGALSAASRWIEQRRRAWDASFDRLDALLAEEDKG